MSKQQVVIKMVGKLQDGSVAKTHQADQVTKFTNESGTISVLLSTTYTSVWVLTPTKEFFLNKSASVIGLFMGQTDTGTKVHFTKKKIVAKLIYWA